ncbi:MAG: TIGR03016 family PEP-CTERM system-associated outer membrane protein [Pseudomonadota bacterium]|nr:TIGR03016 family PEP-CTERM system-associated outer membrane protein [Pseudomonadota bacterium]
MSPTARAEGIRWTPGIEVATGYSDNVALVPSPHGSGDAFTQVAPSLNVVATGPLAAAHVFYVLQNLLYRSRTDLDQSHSLLHSDAHAETASRLLSIDAAADVSRDNTSLLGPQAVDSSNATTNLSTVRTWQLSPVLAGRIGGEGNGELRLTHRVLDSGSGGGAYNSNDNRIEAKLDSGSAASRASAGLSVYRDQVDFASSQSSRSQNALAHLDVRVNPVLRWLNEAGAERFDFAGQTGTVEGGRWSTGIRWSPTPLSSAELSVGHRPFGPTYDLDLIHHASNSYARVTYNQDVTTAQSTFGLPATTDTLGFLETLLAPTTPDPALRGQLAHQLINDRGLPASLAYPTNFLSTNTFLDKRFEAKLGYNSGKSTALLAIYDEIRQALDNTLAAGAADFAVSRRIRTDGAGVSLGIRTAPRLTLASSLNLSRFDFSDIAQVDRQLTFTLGAFLRLSPDARAALEFRRLQRTSTDANSAYLENSVRVSLSQLF